jgi:hypothetical protein
MASTYTLITSQTLASSAGTVTFSAIPNTFTDLVLKASVRNTDTGGGLMYVYFNGDAANASGYSKVIISGNGSTVSNSWNNQSSATIDTSGETANTFTSFEMYIPQYNSTGNKQISFDYAVETNASTVYSRVVAALLDTNTAISSISLFNVSTLQFVAGSSFYLYGISNA